MMDLILYAKRETACPRELAAPLMQACREHLRLHKAAYGTEFLKPKHHWLLDIPAQFFRDDIVLDAFVIERLHLAVKGVAENIKNTTAFEMSVLSGLLNVQFRKAANAMDGSADGSPLQCLSGNLRRIGHVDVAAHMSFLSLQV